MKAIDPSARETARALARRSGLPLAEWANRLLQEDDPADVRPPPIRVAALGRAPEPAPPPRPDPAPSAEIVAALDRLTQRMERSEQSTADLIGGVEKTLEGLSSRLETGEREQAGAVARFEAAVEDLRGEQSRMAERLQQVADEASSFKETALTAAGDRFQRFESRAKRALAGVRDELDGLHGHVAAANAEAVGIVDAGLARLVERLELAETRTAQVLKGVAGVLAERAEAPQPAERTPDDLDARFDRIERVLQAIGDQARAAEQHSAQTVERLEQAVARTAGDLTQKIDGVEQRSAAAVQKLASEIARIADVMQARMAGADAAADRTREALAGQIARISESLTERIAGGEQRSATACDEVAAQVASLGERLQAHQEAVSNELAEQIKQGEIRAARLLEDARERVRREAPEARAAAAGPPPPRAQVYPGELTQTFGASRRDGAGRRWTDTVYDPGFGARGVPVHAAPDLFAVDAGEGRAEWTPTVQKLMDQARFDDDGAIDGEPQQSTFGWLLKFGKKHRA